MEFINHPKIIFIVAILSTPLYLTLARGFWGERFESLAETIKYLIWPDWYSFFKGKFWQDIEATELFYLYVFLCVGWVLAVTEIISRTLLN